jgi:phosphoglycolate phosphatase-like HAD superfamily hydrolase
MTPFLLEYRLIWKQYYQSKTPIYIGDTLKDKEAAEKAGWPFIWVTYGWEIPPQEYPRQAASIEEVLRLLKR